MLNSTGRFADSLYLRLAGGDSVRADAVRARVHDGLLKAIMATYPVLALAVIGLYVTRPAPVDYQALADQRTAAESYAVEYVDAYLSDLSNPGLINRFCLTSIPTTALPAGGRALRASSALPGQAVAGFQTWSVIVDAEIPKAASSLSMVPISFEVWISVDPTGRQCAAALPAARPVRGSGQPVELVAQTEIAQGRPAYNTAYGFLNALVIGQGDLAPFLAAGSGLRPADPPRFTTMRIDKMVTNSDLAVAQDVPPKADRIEVTVRATMQTASGVQLPMDYPLIMSVAAGRWQVDAINDSPSFEPPNESALTPSTLLPTTTTSPAYPGASGGS